MLKNIALLLPLFVTFYGAILLLFSAKKNRKNRYYLGLFFANSFILFLGHFFSFFNYWHVFKYYDFIFFGALFIFYPLFYFYIKSAFGVALIHTKNIVHYIPALVFMLIIGIITYLSPWEYYEQYMNNSLHNAPVTENFSQTLVWVYNTARYTHLIQIVVYNYIILNFIWRAHKGISNLFSNLDVFQVKSFYTIAISFLIFMSIPGFYVTLLGRIPFEENNWMLLIVCSMFTFLYLILSIIGITQKPVQHLELITFEKGLKNTAYTNTELHQLQRLLTSHFNNEKPWLNPHLNIWDVAKAIGTNRSYVSKIINENMGLNFNDYVNKHRINEAKKLLIKKQHLNMHYISDKVGFGSVNTFIRTFKKFEKCTPTQFKAKNT